MNNRYLKLLGLIVLINWMNISFGQQLYDLKFDKDKYKIQELIFEGKAIKVRAYENIIYVAKPTDTTCQKMNIYIPEEYFQGVSINGFTIENAPIFFPNQIGGYMPAKPAYTLNNFNMGMPPLGDKRPQGPPPASNNTQGPPPGGGMMGGPKQSSVIMALLKGFIVASAGARGRTSKDSNGVSIGKAPAGLVDLKAAIRYLKFNDKLMPGDANKIISNGTSAGGAMSSLLGATGNNPDYEPYLNDLGAAKATDNIFAVSAYCPITNLDHADMAYEWQFYGNNTIGKSGSLTLSEEQIAVSKKLKDLFPEYVNSLNLKDKNGKLLTLDENGNGTFKELVKDYIIASAQKVLDKGDDMSKYSFLTISNGKVVQIDFEAYVKYMERQKTPPAFDALDLSTPENQEFGTSKVDKQHFSQFGMDNSKDKSTSMADKQIVKMLNPMYYIGEPQTNTAMHWRIRHGSKDKDTGLAVSAILGTYLQNKGFDVNLEFPWDKPHSGDYDLPELFDWMVSKCR
jgi:hypothetical protein